LDFGTVSEWTGILLGGLLVSGELVLWAGLLAIVLGLAVAVMSVCPNTSLRLTAMCYIELFRSIPLLALLIFLYYVLGKYTGAFGLSPFYLAVIGLALNEAAYLGDVYRASLESVSEGQWEAAKSIGLSWSATLVLVALPQALPPAIPITLNMAIQLIKNSALASLIAVDEVSMRASILVSETFLPLQVFSLLAILYLLITLPLMLVSSRAERLVARQLGLSDSRPITKPVLPGEN